MVAPVNVSAIIVTRGDVDVEPILEDLPEHWEALLWDNGGRLSRWGTPQGDVEDIEVPDLSVYGRYAAIEYASHDLIYVQDDDCVVSDPRAIVSTWYDNWVGLPGTEHMHMICNMPPEFRHGFYEEHALVGFGAAFHRDAPARAFERFQMHEYGLTFPLTKPTEVSWFHRTCDVLFTALTPRVLVDVPKTNLPWAEDDNRMYRQREHQAERGRMLEAACRVRDATDE